jgi:hypothetical protein
LHKNATDHSARTANGFFKNHSLVEISNPLYSLPDVSPLFLLPSSEDYPQMMMITGHQ